MKGRDEEALETLKKLHGGVSGHDDEFYLKEFHQIKAQYEIEKDEELGIVAIFKRPSYRKRMYLIMTFAAFGQFTGKHTICLTFRALRTLADPPSHL